MARLLGVFAHPDDETAATGGTIAKYAKAGWQVDIIVATRGDAGSWGEKDASSGELLADVRSKELEEAAGVLGIRSITFLDYKDGRLQEVHPGEIENALIQAIQEAKPDVVITHEPAGITNHPDHIKMSYAATYAFQVYAARRAKENPGDPNPPKLYYMCVPESVISYLRKKKLFPGELFGKSVRGVDDRRITTVINIQRFAPAKLKALHAHVTQRPILDKYMNIPHGPFLVQEYFIQRMIGVQEVFMGKNDRISNRL